MTSLHYELEKKLQDPNATAMSLPLEFFKTITCDFSSELGRGGYGVVYKGVLRSGKIIAVKKLFEIRLNHEAFQNEISYLMRIKHPNVVQFVGYCAESKWEAVEQPSGSGKLILAELPKRLLCFEYVSNKSLDRHIADSSLDLEWNIRYKIIMGICSGLHFLHDECHIIHLDLKPQNILMDSNMKPKIADFGLSRIFGEQQSKDFTDTSAGTCGYMAPEYLTQGLISKKADIFSLGVIIIEIVTGHRDYPYFQLDNPESTATSCQNFAKEVLGSWRNKFESAPKYISMEKYNLQVKQCIAIALNCVDPSMEKRPMVKDIIQVLNAVDKMEANEELPAEMQCKDKSLVLDSTVSNELMLHSVTEDMSNIKTDGTVGDAKKSQEYLLPTPLWTSSTSSQNQLEAANESNEPQQASDKTSEMEPHEELRPDKSLVLNTITSKDLSPQSVRGEIFINKIDGKMADEAKCDESLLPTPTLSDSNIGNLKYQEGAQAFSEPQSTPDTSTETEVITRSSILLDFCPIELRFHFEPNKLIACSLHLTNNTDEQVAFGLLKKTDEQTCFLSRLPMFGIVDPRTTYTLVVKMDEHRNLPQERKVDLILQTSTYYEVICDEGMCKKHFQHAEELGYTVHKVTLEGVCALQGDFVRSFYLPSIPSIKIISMEDNCQEEVDDNIGSVSSIYANQIEPSIIAGYFSGHVHIWNCDTQKSMGCIKFPKGGAASTVKFIARKGWFLVGSDDGFIHVYDYKKSMQKIKSIKAHGSDSGVHSLATHRTESYVLSASSTGIKLWDWDHGWFGWKCIQTFKEHSVSAVAFNPEDCNNFACAFCDGTIKVWSLDSPKSIYTLSGHTNKVNCLDFFARGGDRQYLISGSNDGTAKIWDMQKKEGVGTLPHKSAVFSVASHPNRPVLVTGTQDGHVRLWNSFDLRLSKILNIGCHSCVARFNESGRLVVEHENEGVFVIEM